MTLPDPSSPTRAQADADAPSPASLPPAISGLSGVSGVSGVPPARPLPWPIRWLLLAFAVLSLATGVVGIFVPGLPTTVFVLMAAWAAARSSPRLHGWLMRHRIFGPMIIDWQNGGTVKRHVKWRASAAMALCAVIVLFTAHRPWTAWLAIGSMAAVLLWLWRRPEPPAPPVLPAPTDAP